MKNGQDARSTREFICCGTGILPVFCGTGILPVNFVAQASCLLLTF
ncbi:MULTISPECIES: hypothetical protein [unclassified Microcoleus]|nr:MULTISPECIES: hypothetical protein [unclassified Microcoleus]MCC3546845.1 hypothetical protein [Microcoleus sp. PH2017_24_DOB_U_A]MCC3553283.1 hypothetical protein [Microcoleus sp. PH2017_35_SFW_U_B]MCC3565682.1 hypothetical protein [Microcoleus sp. PH2017_31_RDM_U_A]MCC3586124.1 hypothetical protein [Microcoleus sp. PH2017_30_WIL_O_A]MCC3624296.1 hypothetical protein [Microcoleus sp. PH2017_36_ELK_O_B]